MALARSFAEQHFVSQGLAVQLDVHAPHGAESESERANWHAHLLITTRRLEGEAFAAKKARDLDPEVRQAGGRARVIAVVVCIRAARSLRTRWMKLQSLFIVPALFIVVGALGVSFRSAENAVAWALMATAFFPAGFFSAPHPLAIDRANRRLQLGPSWVTAFRVPLIFVVRYALAVAIAVRPDQAKLLLLITSVFSGGVVGYYVGWCVGLLRAYWRPRHEIAATA